MEETVSGAKKRGNKGSKPRTNGHQSYRRTSRQTAAAMTLGMGYRRVHPNKAMLQRNGRA